MNGIKRDKVAFEHDAGGFHFVVTYLHEPKGDALVEITHNGETVKEFLWPAYKIWNIQAHADDIAADVEHGLRIAGWNGISGATLFVAKRDAGPST